MTMMNVEVLCDQMAIPPNGRASQIDQLRHRANLVDIWRNGGASFEKAKVLDVGCGQGDQTVALLGVDDAIEVVGADPGPPDYGSPFTLSQAQAKILASPLFKGRIQFHQGDAAQVVELYSSSHFDTAVFSHCLWYYPSKEAVKSAFIALKNAGVLRLAIAEWSLQVSRMEAIPHLLAVLAQTMVASEVANVRLVLPPRVIKQIALEAGWTLSNEQILPSPKEKDGVWEVQAALALKRSGSNGATSSDFSKHAMGQHLEALQLAVDAAGGVKEVQTMDVWVAVFK